MSEPTVIVRRNPTSGWWHWVCTDCRNWSRWSSFLHAVWHADKHARHFCHTAEGVRPQPLEQTA